jgi:hypothetical protein
MTRWLAASEAAIYAGEHPSSVGLHLTWASGFAAQEMDAAV